MMNEEMMTLQEIHDRLWSSRGLGGIELGNDEFKTILASLAHLAKESGDGEAVAEVCSGFELRWVGSGPIAPIIERNGITVGTKLYTAQPKDEPSLPVEAVDEKSYRQGWHVGYNEGMTHKGPAEEAFQRGFDAALAHPRPTVPDGYELVWAPALAALQKRDSVFNDADRGGHLWYWQGDGADVPESLTCSVVMSADTLRELIAKAAPTGEQAGVVMPSISRERCVEIAKDVARKKATMHSYYAEPFQPHAWVIEAMMVASHEAKPRATGDAEDQLRATLKMRDYRTDGDLLTLVDRIDHMARSDRDNVEALNVLLDTATPSPHVADERGAGVPDGNVVKDAIRLLVVYKTWIGGDRPDHDEDEARLWDETESAITALSQSHVIGVPAPRTTKHYEQDEDEQIDAYSVGHMDGWNACRDAMIAAAPAPGEKS